MSYLREIMQRLQARGAAASGAVSVEPLESHLAAYEARLDACTPAMLQYEWAWIEQHLTTLEHACSSPTMVAAAGGERQLRQLLEESRCFRERLERRFASLAIRPAPHRHAVVATEHAWEVSQPGLRDQWGF